MKKYLLPTLLTLTLITVAPAWAVDAQNEPSTTPAPVRQEIKQNRTNLRQEIKEGFQDFKDKFKNLKTSKEDKKELEEDREDFREAKPTAKQERKTLLSQFKLFRVQAVTKRLRLELTSRHEIRQSLFTALQNRISALSDSSVKTEAQNKLSGFTKLSESYTTHLEAFDALIAKIGTSTTPQSLLPDIHRAANAVKKDLGDMKKVLMDTISFLSQNKKAVPSPTITPSSTPTPVSSTI